MTQQFVNRTEQLTVSLQDTSTLKNANLQADISGEKEKNWEVYVFCATRVMKWSVAVTDIQ